MSHPRCWRAGQKGHNWEKDDGAVWINPCTYTQISRSCAFGGGGRLTRYQRHRAGPERLSRSAGNEARSGYMDFTRANRSRDRSQLTRIFSYTCSNLDIWLLPPTWDEAVGYRSLTLRFCSVLALVVVTQRYGKRAWRELGTPATTRLRTRGDCRQLHRSRVALMRLPDRQGLLCARLREHGCSPLRLCT